MKDAIAVYQMTKESSLVLSVSRQPEYSGRFLQNTLPDIFTGSFYRLFLLTCFTGISLWVCFCGAIIKSRKYRQKTSYWKNILSKVEHMIAGTIDSLISELESSIDEMELPLKIDMENREKSEITRVFRNRGKNISGKNIIGNLIKIFAKNCHRKSYKISRKNYTVKISVKNIH